MEASFGGGYGLCTEASGDAVVFGALVSKSCFVFPGVLVAGGDEVADEGG